MSVELVTTGDGSHSLRNTDLDETYHSMHGAVQESRHVFIANGLDVFLQKLADPLRVFEVGFGTGLNALLTWRWARKHRRHVHYTSIEAFPLEPSVWSKLNYGEHLGHGDDVRTLHRVPWNVETRVEEFFTLFKIHGDIQSWESSEAFHLVYFDAFAPSKQPEMWTLDVLSKVVGAMMTDGVFVTYSAKGQLKRDLNTLGLLVETLAGPPGKKEMVRALKQH